MQPNHSPSSKRRFERVGREVVADSMSDVVSLLTNVANGVKTLNNAVGPDQKGDPQAESHDLSQEWRDRDVDSNQAVATQGYDQTDQQAMIRQLTEGGVNQAEAPRFLTELTYLASNSGQNVAQILPTVQALLTREPGDTTRVLATLNVLSKYERQFPDMGIYDVAQKAARGENVTPQLNALHMMVGNKFGPYSGSDLVAAILGQNLPASPLAQSVDSLDRERNKRRQQQLGLIYDATLIKNQWFESSEKQQQKLYQWMDQKLPGLASSGAGQAVLRLLTSLVTAHAAWQTMQGAAGVGGGGKQLANQLVGQPSQSPFMNPRAHTLTERELRFAAAPTTGTPPTLSGGYSSPSGAGTMPSASQQLGQAANAIQAANPVVQQSEQGNAPAGAQQTTQGQFNSSTLLFEMDKHCTQAQGALEELQLRRKNIFALLGQLDAGNGAINEPYMTPQQIATEAQALYGESNVAMVAITQGIAAGQQLGSQSQGGPLVTLQMQQRVNALVAIQAQIKAINLEAISLSIAMPVEQEIQNYQTRKNEAMRQFKRQQRMWNLGNNYALTYISNINTYLAQLRRNAAQKYANLASQAADDSMRQWASRAAEQQGAQAQQLLDEIADMEYQQAGLMFGGDSDTGIGNGALNAVNASEVRRARFVLAEDGTTEIQIEADKELEDYWNDLLPPDYGTKLEHPKHLPHTGKGDGKKFEKHVRKSATETTEKDGGAEDTDVEADQVIEDYYNNLYQGTGAAGYGHVLENPSRYRNTPTTQVKSVNKSKFTRV